MLYLPYVSYCAHNIVSTICNQELRDFYHGCTTSSPSTLLLMMPTINHYIVWKICIFSACSSCWPHDMLSTLTLFKAVFCFFDDVIHLCAWEHRRPIQSSQLVRNKTWLAVRPQPPFYFLLNLSERIKRRWYDKGIVTGTVCRLYILLYTA